MDDFKNRLLAFAEGHLGLSIRGFEAKCGLTNGSIASIKSKGPSVENVLKISETYPELNLNWLIAGRGEMLIGENTASPANNIHHNNQVFIGNWDGLASALAEVIKSQVK